MKLTLDIDVAALLKRTHTRRESGIIMKQLKIWQKLNLFLGKVGGFLLRRWLTFPSMSTAVINARLDAVETFSTHRSQAAELVKSLKGIQNIPHVLAKLSAGYRNDIARWKVIAQFTAKAQLIRGQVVQFFSSKVPDIDLAIVSKIREGIRASELEELREMLVKTIDWEESKTERRLCISHGVNTELDELKETYACLPATLEALAREIKVRMADHIDESEHLNLVYFPQIGYLHQWVHKPGFSEQYYYERGQALGWQHHFALDRASFFKSEHCHDVDRHLGDIHEMIQGIEVEIALQIIQKTLAKVKVLVEAADAIAELDW